MDFTELESVEGLRFPWNTYPSSPSQAASLIIPLSAICTPLHPLADLPLLPYHPLSCSSCLATLNPYARVDYRSALWICPLCRRKNPFPRSYAGIADHNLPAELFPTHSTVEYLLPYQNCGSGGVLAGPAFLFVVDVCSAEEELRALKNEVLCAVANLPENALVGLVSFGEMVWVHDLGCGECSRAVVFCGDREISSGKVRE